MYLLLKYIKVVVLIVMSFNTFDTWNLLFANPEMIQ